MTAKRIWLAGLALFALLSVTDFVQTYALIADSDGGVYEANPVANAWLEQHGWGGLAAFKAGAVAVFVGAAALLLVRRPNAGAGVMALGCAALFAVTVYSGQLLANPYRSAVPGPANVTYLDQPLPHPGKSMLLLPGEGRRFRTVPLPICTQGAE
ncbi:MAG TPA: DUF5658 family protein [Fimbriiglobus sp.]|nr:DUF5658 family protein [Fimbriiglobus sp.]